MLIVEVCQGPDCTGLGGGAALLEIEELIQEKQSEENISLCLVGGGCRDLCTVGPNVRIFHKLHGSIETFSHVSDGSKCDLAVQNAAALEASMGEIGRKASAVGVVEGEVEVPSSLNSAAVVAPHQSMMARRAGRKRWESLRKISRRIAKCKKDVNNDPDFLLDKDKCQRKVNSLKNSMAEDLVLSSNAELSAAKDEIERARAVRRQERLRNNINRSLEECYEEDYSDDSSNASSVI
jgi:hypothetical protein